MGKNHRARRDDALLSLGLGATVGVAFAGPWGRLVARLDPDLRCLAISRKREGPAVRQNGRPLVA
jgi:hypothetical protein